MYFNQYWYWYAPDPPPTVPVITIGLPNIPNRDHHGYCPIIPDDHSQPSGYGNRLYLLAYSGSDIRNAQRQGSWYDNQMKICPTE